MRLNSLAFLLLAALSLAGLGRSQALAQDVSPQRQAEIVAKLSRWPEYKSRAKRLKDQFLTNIAKDSRFDHKSFQDKLQESWSLVERLEGQELNRSNALRGQLNQERDNGKIKSEDYEMRTAAVQRLFEIRMLCTYGYLIPQILDKSTEVGGIKGRHFAGAEWELALSKEECGFVESVFAYFTGFPSSS